MTCFLKEFKKLLEYALHDVESWNAHLCEWNVKKDFPNTIVVALSMLMVATRFEKPLVVSSHRFQ